MQCSWVRGFTTVWSDEPSVGFASVYGGSELDPVVRIAHEELQAPSSRLLEDYLEDRARHPEVADIRLHLFYQAKNGVVRVVDANQFPTFCHHVDGDVDEESAVLLCE